MKKHNYMFSIVCVFINKKKKKSNEKCYFIEGKRKRKKKNKREGQSGRPIG